MNITKQQEVFEDSSVIVILDQTVGSPPYSYDVTVDPPPVELMANRSMYTTVLAYNTLYNVSVVATHPCGNTSSVVAFIELYYRK